MKNGIKRVYDTVSKELKALLTKVYNADKPEKGSKLVKIEAKNSLGMNDDMFFKITKDKIAILQFEECSDVCIGQLVFYPKNGRVIHLKYKITD